MPVSAKSKKTLWTGVGAFSGLLLLFSSIPFLNIGTSTQIVSGVSLGTLFGILLLVFAYQYHKGHA